MTQSRRRTDLTRKGIGIAILTAVVAGCGSNSPTSTSGSTGGPPANGVSAAFAFSRCMRAHGLSNFPDPHVSTGAGHVAVGVMVKPGMTASPQFKAAQKACNAILPAPSPSQIAQQNRQELQGKLGFARCLRRHGFPGFPDPNTQGRLTPEMVTAAGVDIHTPAFASAAEACAGSSGGTISAAQIKQALGR